jgi:hypothetical protein
MAGDNGEDNKYAKPARTTCSFDTFQILIGLFVVASIVRSNFM